MQNVYLDSGTVKIVQRVWHPEVGRPKSETSRRVLGIGDLVDRYRLRSSHEDATPDGFIFQQRRAPGRPLWDSGVRAALHRAAAIENCDFPGLGPHSFRRANILRATGGWQRYRSFQIAGHHDLQTTGEYTFVTAKRQIELTRRIQKPSAQLTQNTPPAYSVGSTEHSRPAKRLDVSTSS
ncbi:MAG TPA: hypothetical protein VEQ63_03745 [Bryobacteraceae bacterium]|nr:hypothetical protein [Bryobacteraceae bacterium]